MQNVDKMFLENHVCLIYPTVVSCQSEVMCDLRLQGVKSVD